MNMHEEISKVARELYEKSGRINGKDEANWLAAEKIVLARHATPAKAKPAVKAVAAKAAKSTNGNAKTAAKKTVKTTKVKKTK